MAGETVRNGTEGVEAKKLSGKRTGIRQDSGETVLDRRRRSNSYVRNLSGHMTEMRKIRVSLFFID